MTSKMQKAARMLKRIPRKTRETFILREVKGMSYAEIGVAQGIAREEVERRLLDAYQRIAAEIWRESQPSFFDRIRKLFQQERSA